MSAVKAEIIGAHDEREPGARWAMEALSALVFFAREVGSGGEVEAALLYEVADDGRLVNPITPSPDAVDALLQSFKPAAERKAELFDDRVLMADGIRFAWWSPARVAPMVFVGEKRRTVRLTVPWPPLLFVATANNLRVAALGKNKRPAAKDRVFHAPLMNIGGDGLLCWGNIDRPPACSMSTRNAWEDAIYRTKFSHVNHHTTLKGGATNDEHVSLYRELAAAKATSFPRQRLAARRETVADFVLGGGR